MAGPYRSASVRVLVLGAFQDSIDGGPADGEELGDGVLAGGVLLDEAGPAGTAGFAACSCNNYRYD
ncbi:hypothetical protein GCM10023196_030770 [Actinoallomurus vinaceus]|uniref:Uncharacterized protein n=1 Tax=Actinoallomurus vinaceus TaxID=1080074 RepID=A0ABP8UB53_9ACTN